MLMTFFRRLAAPGIDGDQLGATTLRFLPPGPKVQVRDDRIGTPDQDQPGILKLLHIGPDRCADRRPIAYATGSRADRAVEQRCTEAMEKPPVNRTRLHIH